MIATGNVTTHRLTDEAEVTIVREHNECNCRHQEPNLFVMEHLFGQQQDHTGAEDEYRRNFMMMFTPTMVKRVQTDGRRQAYHEYLK